MVGATIEPTSFHYHEQHFQYRCHGHRLPLHSHVPQWPAPGQLPGQRPLRSRARPQTDRFLPYPPRMVRIPQGHGSLHLFSPPSRPLLHFPFHPRQGAGTCHGGRLFHPSLPPASFRTGLLLVPHRPSIPAFLGVGRRVLHCLNVRQARRARPGLLPFRGDDASRQAGRNGADAGQPVPGRRGRELV